MNLTLFHFIRPYWLFAFIPLVIITGLILRRKLQRGNWVNVCDEELLPYILQQKPVTQSRLPISINVISSILTIIALAGPTWERVPSPAFRNDSGLVIALDLSRSMEAGDIKPSRLIRARYKIEDILKQREDGQSALLVYAGDAFTVTPLTNDNATIASQLEALTPEIMPSAGSNTVLAVEKAVELLKQGGLRNGQVLLVTDGVNPDEISAVLKKLEGYQLSVLAVGTEEGAPISEADGGFLKDESGAIVMPKLPVSDLQKLASDGHGIYQAITDNDNDIKNLLAVVDKSVQKAVDNNQDNLLLEKWDEKGVWLLLLVLPLAALSFRRGLLAIAFLIILPLPKNSYALEWQDLWQTKDQQAYQAYKQGKFDKAAQLFEDPAWQAAALYKSKQPEAKQLKTPDSATGFYNQGNVLAKAGKYEEAIKAYEQALKLDPKNEDAKYNKKLVEEELKKQQQQQEQQKQSDKNQQDQKDQPKQDKQQQKDSKDKQGDKSNKDSKDNKDDKSEKNQQKPEPAENKKDNKSEQEKQQQDKQQQQKEQQKQQQAAQAKNQPPEKTQQAQSQQAKLADDEKKQADEQWLNRIPDDPAGLLRRKFKYQYGQRQRQDFSAQSW